MKKNKNKNATYKRVAMVGNTRRAVTEPQKKTKKPIKKDTVIISVSAIALALALIVSVVFLVLRDNSFSYMKSDLTKYITLSEKDYKSYTCEMEFDEVTEKDVQRKIMGLLYKNKSSEPENKGAEMYRVPVSVGDTVHIYYRGYTVDENGKETDVSGASNLFDNYHTLGIGSLSFIAGFEEGLIGAVPWDHQYSPEFNLIKEGVVRADDVIYLSYDVIRSDGTSEKRTDARIDLSKQNVDAVFGEGFEAYFESGNISVGSRISEAQIFKIGDVEAVYSGMTVSSVIRCDSEPLTIDARFPADYSEKSLRGKDVKFDVYFKSSVVYSVPEYNEEFITETLKISPETLEKYEGDSLVEKHSKYLLEEATAENEKRRDSLREEAIWDYYNSVAKFKKLPKDALESVYNGLYYEANSEYSLYYSSSYSSFEAYARARYGLSANADVEKYLRSEAEGVVKEKLIFYYIIRKENLIPSKEEYSAAYDRIVEEYLDYYIEEIYDEELKKIESEEEKASRIDEIKKEMMNYYGEEYFEELVYYDYAYDTIISYVNVIEK